MPRSQTPPHSLDAEKEILGAVLKFPDAINEVSLTVKASDFYIPKHSTVFSAFLDLYHHGEPCDLTTVAEKLGTEGIKSIGGRSYLVELSEFSVTPSSVRKHVSILKEKSTARHLLKTVGDITVSIYSGDKSLADILASAEENIFHLTEATFENRFKHISETVPDVLKEIEDYQSGKALDGLIMTGFGDLDKHLQGFSPGELIVVASNTGQGKTQFVLQMLENNAKRGKSGAIFALEMTADELVTRLLAAESNISSDLFRSVRGLSSDQWDEITRASARIGSLPIFVDDSPVLSTTEIISKARKIKTQHRIELLVVDYAQLMRGKGENRNLEVGEITRTLKIVAKDIEVPVIAVSQLTRDNMKQNRQPVLSDLRDSGSIEQDANTVIFPYVRPVDVGGTIEKQYEMIIAKRRKGGRPEHPIRMDFKNGIWYDFVPDHIKATEKDVMMEF